MSKPVDRQFLVISAILVLAGFFIFTSASLGLLARSGANFYSIATNQLLLGVGVGSLLAFGAAKMHYTHWRKIAFLLFLAGLLATLLVFVPGLGFKYNGATRWIHVLGLSIQPAEFLKIAFVIYFAAWLSGVKENVRTWKYGTIPLVILLGIVGAVMLAQPDTATFAVMGAAIIAMFIAAGGKWSHIAILGAISLIALGALAFTRPYIADRLQTFFNPETDPLGSGYQLQQSLIAIGSGGFFGRGFGQSVQKFNYLPEPIGDSIFAVQAEEFGFVGSTLLLLFFLGFALRGLKIALRAPDNFGRLLATGIVILIVSGSFVNIASMLGVIPLSGLPLLFVSHGGTALLFALAEVGIVLNISRYMTQ